MFITFMVLIVVVIFIIVIIKIKQHQQAKIYEQQKKLQEEERQIQKQKRDEAKQRRLEAKEKDKVKYLEEINMQNTEHPEYRDMYFSYNNEICDTVWKYTNERIYNSEKEEIGNFWNKMIEGKLYDKKWNNTPHNAALKAKEDHKRFLDMIQEYKNFAEQQSRHFQSDDIDIASYISRLCDVHYGKLCFYNYLKSRGEKPFLLYDVIFLDALKKIVNELKEREELKHIYEEEGRTDKLLTFSEKIFLHRATKYINEQTY